MPLYVKKEDVDAAYIKEQEEIFKGQVAELKKPDNVKEGIVKGKISKAGAQRPAFQQLRLVGRACTVGPDLQVQGLAGFGIPVQDLAHHGHPLRKELLEVAVGIDAVDEGGGTYSDRKSVV